MEAVYDCCPDKVATLVSPMSWKEGGVEGAICADYVSMALGGCGGGGLGTNPRVGIM